MKSNSKTFILGRQAFLSEEGQTELSPVIVCRQRDSQGKWVRKWGSWPVLRAVGTGSMSPKRQSLPQTQKLALLTQ